jgi:hypothetical protein
MTPGNACPAACSLPRIKRARGYRLYDFGGRRYLDLYQQGGGAVLGHGRAGVMKDVKNVLSRGLASSLASEHAGRFEKALRRLFPAYGTVRFFTCIHNCLDAVSAFLGEGIGVEEIFDPGLGLAFRDQPVSYWRPFLPPGSEGSPEVMIPILPFTGAGVTAACFRSDSADSISPSNAVPPYLLAGALRGLADLSGFSRGDTGLERAIHGARGWRLTGPYLSSLSEESGYGEIFNSFLQGGVILSPTHPGPSILPAETSPEEARLLRGLFIPKGG